MRTSFAPLFAFGVFMTAIFTLPAIAVAQTNPDAFNVLKTKKDETFSLPAAAANRDLSHAMVYTYDAPKGQNWILGITNNVTYSRANTSVAIVRLQEPAPSQKFIQIEMYAGPNHDFIVGVNTTDTGYSVVNTQDGQGWATDGPISVSHADNQGLTVTDGKRIVVDRLDIQGFSVGSIAAYGKKSPADPDNAVGGQLTFEMLAGSPSDSPTYYVPLGVMLGMGGLMGVLLMKKRRKPEPYQ
ncbi:MAG: hypothetical protein ABI361_12030 [Nitrososphaera sp.]